MSMKTTLICSTPNGKSDLEKMINEYFYSENYIITDRAGEERQVAVQEN